MTTPPRVKAKGRLGALGPVWEALAAMTAVQSVVSMIVIAVPVFAVTAAPDMGVDARVIGFYTALIYILSAVSAPIGGYFTDRMGPARMSQVCMLLVMLGIGLVATAWLPLVALGALLIGAGNGPATPASTYILSRRTPPSLLSLVLSVKQTGASIGTAAAGIAVPLIVIFSGWRSAALACAAIAIVLALVLEPLRRDMDRDAVADSNARREKRPSVFTGLRLILGNRRLTALALCGLSYCMLQISITSYFITYLVEEIGVGKVKAGYLFSVSVTAAIVARVVIGAIADRVGDCKGVLAALGIGMGITAIGFMLLPHGAPTWQIAVLGIVFASSSLTWSGVYLAEAVPYAPEGQIGTLIGALMIFTYIGSISGPALFGVILTTGGSYPMAFATVGVPALLSSCAFLGMRRAMNARRLASGDRAGR